MAVRSWVVLFSALVASTVAFGLPAATSAAAPGKTPISPDSAGYAVAPTGSTTYSGEVKMPAVTCSSAITGHLEIGEFIGTKIGATTYGEIGLAVSVDCSGKTPEYLVDIIANGVDTHMLTPVKVGNRFKFVANASTSEVTGTATDVTTNSSISATGEGGAPNSIAVTAGSDGSTHWPPFTKISFTKIMVNGKPLSASTPTKVNEGVTVSKNKTVIEIRTSPLSSTGDAFSLRYLTNSP